MTHERVPPAGAEVSLGPPTGGTPHAPLPPPPPRAIALVPQAPPGIELLGRLSRSGQRRPPSLVRRGDGQMVQLTPLLYAVLEHLDGRHDYAGIAEAVGHRTGKRLTADDVAFLVERKLAPLGLARAPDGTIPATKKANPLLALRPRLVVTDPKVTGRVAAPFEPLFLPPIAFALTLAFLLLSGWLVFERGLGAAAHAVLYEPGLLLVVVALAVVSAGFHELGHAAACGYGGGTPGAMGVGLYLVWPAFFTDVTDTYRLERRDRLRVDLGGIYFNAVFAVGMFALWATTGWEALLVVIPLQFLQIVRQLVPFIRLDGYHILADITGVPDLFAHVRPILSSMLPWRREPRVQALRPWVRFVVTGWVLLVIPLLVATFAAIVIVFPRVAATAWDSVGLQWHGLLVDRDAGDLAAASVHALSIVALVLPIAGMVYLIARVTRRIVRRVWGATEGRPFMRGVASVVAGSLIAFLATVWWPDGQYRPIRPTERGVLEVPLGPWAGERDTDTTGAESMLFSRSPSAGSLPSSGAAVDPTGGSERSGGSAAADAVRDPPWGDHRFTPPPPPGEGDNQALAINYNDGSVLLVMALSLVLDYDELVDSRNEAYALASCIACTTAAIAYQVVVMTTDADVVIPENVAVAVNVLCLECATFALAIQTILTIDEPLSDETLQELQAAWVLLEAIRDNLDKLTLDQIYALLQVFEQHLVAILAEELTSAETGEVSDGDPTPAPAESPMPTPEPTTEPTPEPSPTSEPTTEPTPEPSPSPTATPEPTP